MGFGLRGLAPSPSPPHRRKSGRLGGEIMRRAHRCEALVVDVLGTASRQNNCTRASGLGTQNPEPQEKECRDGGSRPMCIKRNF